MEYLNKVLGIKTEIKSTIEDLPNIEIKEQTGESEEDLFTSIYKDEEEKLNTIPEVLVNDVLKIEEVKVKTGKTNPPAYLNEGTLLTEMEKNNLGTVATRADIIEKLFNSFINVWMRMKSLVKS